MNGRQIERIPISQIRVVNPRARDKVIFQQVTGSIQMVGLKKPVTVSRRAIAHDGTQYDLICGQGRIEAVAALGEQSVPAIIIEADREDQLLMSLVENIARRPPSNRDIVREVSQLLGRKNSPDQIAKKLGLDRTYIYGIIHLLKHSEDFLITAVESGRLPISVAVKIASGNDREVQQALADAYEKGDLRGDKLKAAKRMIAERIRKMRARGKASSARQKLTGDALVREYQHQIREQKSLIKRANTVKDHLLLLVSAFRQMLADEHFVTLLQAQRLQDMPEQLALRVK